jgi:hypothetical protein
LLEQFSLLGGRIKAVAERSLNHRLFLHENALAQKDTS